MSDMTSAPSAISFRSVAKEFSGHRALRELDLDIAFGELVSVVGVTGCGKSTMFNLILGLFPPTRGSVTVEGHDPYADFAWFRRRVAVVFQDSRLLPWRTAFQNVCIGMKFAGVPKAEWPDKAHHWLSTLGLGGREHAYPHQLSGGQRQRVSLARAFAVDPDLILCDESFSALDEITATALRAEFVALVREGGKTGVVITHSIDEAMTLGDRILVLRPPGHLAADLAVPVAPDRDELDRLRQEILTNMSPSTPSGPAVEAGLHDGGSGAPAVSAP
jgi:NitT/TauT family transport system ATP-binding protein